MANRNAFDTSQGSSPMYSLSQSLNNHSLSLLRAIAELNGLTLRSNKVRTAVAQIEKALLNGDHLAILLASCPVSAIAALASLQSSEGRSPSAPFEREFGRIRTFGPGRLEREKPYREPLSAAEELWYRGLIHRAFAQGPNGMVEFLYVPDDLLALLPSPRSIDMQFNLAASLAPRTPIPATNALLQDACTLLCLVNQGDVRLTRTNDPLAWRATSLYDLNRQMLQPLDEPAQAIDPEAPGSPLALLLSLAAHLDWLKPDGYRLALTGPTVASWLEADRAMQRRILMGAWNRATTWNDLCRAPALCCEQTGSWSNDPVATRNRLRNLLALLDSSEWYGIDDFVAAVKAHQPDFQRPAGNYDTWYVRQRNAQTFLRGFENWQAVEGELLRFIVSGPLHWLGITDLAATDSQPAPPAFFHFTRDGASWIVDDRPPSEPESNGRITVEPDFSLSVSGDSPLKDRFQVSRFTVWEAAPERSEPSPVFRYRITQTALRDAAARGITADRVLSFLQSRTSDDLPANVVAALKRWHEKES
ncbi:MAG: hypothetical protein U9R25_13175 [Chloroflexota bacterium]|nr:hypothetical protein [Chloroflexota bacterium]